MRLEPLEFWENHAIYWNINFILIQLQIIVKSLECLEGLGGIEGLGGLECLEGLGGP